MLLHRILPCKERLSQLLPTTSPICNLCQAQQPDSLLHAFFNCDKNREAAQYLLHLTRVYDSRVSNERVLKLQINTEVLYELPTVLILCTGLHLIWRNRQEKKSTSLYETRAELECLVCLLRKSRPRVLREAAKIVENTLQNFPYN